MEYPRLMLFTGHGQKYLDYFNCALRREILRQGHMYISEGHVCFFQNILGLVTEEVIDIKVSTHPWGLPAGTSRNHHAWALTARPARRTSTAPT